MTKWLLLVWMILMGLFACTSRVGAENITPRSPESSQSHSTSCGIRRDDRTSITRIDLILPRAERAQAPPARPPRWRRLDSMYQAGPSAQTRAVQPHRAMSLRMGCDEIPTPGLPEKMGRHEGPRRRAWRWRGWRLSTSPRGGISQQALAKARRQNAAKMLQRLIEVDSETRDVVVQLCSLASNQKNFRRLIADAMCISQLVVHVLSLS